MNFKHVMIAGLISCFTFSVAAQEQSQLFSSYMIGFYNLENLFDTIDSPDTNDSEYLPNGANKWTSYKYDNKLHNMAYAISKFPKEMAILGVSEVENRLVLEDLVAQPELKDRNLQIIHRDGPDRRGVDCGLLYDPKQFVPTNVVSHKLQTEAENFISRDQICVTGLLAGEEIHVIVLHWPSKYGGEKRSTPRRRDAALTTKAICDSIFAIDAQAKIIIMGDLNDDPTAPSLVKYLGAKSEKKDVKPGELYNPCYNIYKQGIGSLGYNDVWCLYDQVLVSQALLDRDDLSKLVYWKSEIFNREFLKEQDGKRKGYPKRTSSGGVWTNGYSDHFPSFIWLIKEAQ
ncbi:MAG: endonuclease/exonuclease/phosphatase family protein [Paludibacteraceae bacterium]|jgi:hypothetical protein|nr:endonuclease/exonuclease/phosphatase family protein [Paludibacteraceae bacterium]